MSEHARLRIWRRTGEARIALDVADFANCAARVEPLDKRTNGSASRGGKIQLRSSADASVATRLFRTIPGRTLGQKDRATIPIPIKRLIVSDNYLVLLEIPSHNVPVGRITSAVSTTLVLRSTVSAP